MTPVHPPGFLAAVARVRPHVRELTVGQVLAHPAAYRIVDVREDDEWRQGHIRGAEHLGKGIIERDIETRVPDKHTPLLLYCGGGFRSALAAHSIQQMGYDNVYSLAGGMRAWQAANGPVE